jgi:hypothetical protein
MCPEIEQWLVHNRSYRCIECLRRNRRNRYPHFVWLKLSHISPCISHIIPLPAVAATKSSHPPLSYGYTFRYEPPIVRIRDTSAKTCSKNDRITKGQLDAHFAANMQHMAHICRPLWSTKRSFPHCLPIDDTKTRDGMSTQLSRIVRLRTTTGVWARSAALHTAPATRGLRAGLQAGPERWARAPGWSAELKRRARVERFLPTWYNQPVVGCSPKG